MTLVGRPAQNHPQQVGKRGALDKVDDRRTPRELWDKLHAEFHFTLDAAASESNHLAPMYYDAWEDGLTSSWGGCNVWCNPPYSDIRPWVEKAWSEMRRPHLERPGVIVMLLPANRTEQGWWQDLIEPARWEGTLEVRFLRGRLRFDTPDHDYTKQPKGNRPPFGVVVVIWRRDTSHLCPCERRAALEREWAR